MYLTDRQAIWHIARKFNDYFLRQYKVHLQIICLQKLPSLFLKPLVSRSVHSLLPGIFFPWLLLNHYLSICERLVHFGFGFELHVWSVFFRSFLPFTMGISVCDRRRLQTCRLADLQTRRFVDLHFWWQGFGLILFILCLLLANCKVCLGQTPALAGCKHSSARFDRWLEILAVEDLTSEERWPKLQREQRRRRRVGSSSGFKTEGHLWAGNKSAQNLIVGEFL